MSNSAPVPFAGAFFVQLSMLIRVTCPCGHSGVVDASTLPCSLTCSSCSTSSYVEPKDGRRIRSTDAFEEWLSGERERPQAQSR